MTRLGADPAVSSWRIACAPRPRYSTGGRHWWRELVTETWRAAMDARDGLRESGVPIRAGAVPGTAGANVSHYQLTDQEFDQLYPKVGLGDVMRELSAGAVEPGRWCDR